MDVLMLPIYIDDTTKVEGNGGFCCPFGPHCSPRKLEEIRGGLEVPQTFFDIGSSILLNKLKRWLEQIP